MTFPCTFVSAGLCLAMLTATSSVASAGTIRTWTYDGAVDTRLLDGTPCVANGCTAFDHVLRAGSAVTVTVAYDHGTPVAPDCPGYYPGAVKSLHVTFGGRTFTTTGFAWMDAYGFVGGCGPSAVGFELVTPYGYDGLPLPGTEGRPQGAYASGGYAGMFGGGDGWPDALPSVLWYQGPEVWVRDTVGSRRLSFRSTLERREPAAIPEPTALLLLALGMARLVCRRADGSTSPLT